MPRPVARPRDPWFRGEPEPPRQPVMDYCQVFGLGMGGARVALASEGPGYIWLHEDHCEPARFASNEEAMKAAEPVVDEVQVCCVCWPWKGPVHA